MAEVHQQLAPMKKILTYLYFFAQCEVHLNKEVHKNIQWLLRPNLEQVSPKRRLIKNINLFHRLNHRVDINQKAVQTEVCLTVAVISRYSLGIRLYSCIVLSHIEQNLQIWVFPEEGIAHRKIDEWKGITGDFDYDGSFHTWTPRKAQKSQLVTELQKLSSVVIDRLIL